MQGRILELDTMGAGGTILGYDGNRYAFVIGEWRAAEKAAAGIAVDFILGDNTTAREIFPLPSQSSAGQPAAQPWASAASAASSSATASTGPSTQTVYVPPPAQSQSTGGASVVLGLIGIALLIGGFVVPIVSTVLALVVGLVGADSGKRHKNTTGLVLARISWIGALVFLIVQILLVGLIISFFAMIFGISPEDMRNWTIV